MLWLKRITHETDEVRIRALKHLQTFLKDHRSELNRMILSETDVHPLIVEVCFYYYYKNINIMLVNKYYALLCNSFFKAVGYFTDWMSRQG